MVNRFVDVDECEESFVLMSGCGATPDRLIPPIEGITKFEDCIPYCLDDDECEGFSMTDGKCQLYYVAVNNTKQERLRELYVRESCL